MIKTKKNINYFLNLQRIKKEFTDLCTIKTIDWTQDPYNDLLRKQLMTCCDLAAVTKPWQTHKKVVNLVTREFFAQGDRERRELHIEPNVIETKTIFSFNY
jgi:hypothetical protein